MRFLENPQLLFLNFFIFVAKSKEKKYFYEIIVTKIEKLFNEWPHHKKLDESFKGFATDRDYTSQI